jgi:hypothetical protein
MTIEDRQPRCCSSSKKVVEHNSNFTRAYARSGGFHDINHPAIGVPPIFVRKPPYIQPFIWLPAGKRLQKAIEAMAQSK